MKPMKRNKSLATYDPNASTGMSIGAAIGGAVIGGVAGYALQDKVCCAKNSFTPDCWATNNVYGPLCPSATAPGGGIGEFGGYVWLGALLGAAGLWYFASR